LPPFPLWIISSGFFTASSNLTSSLFSQIGFSFSAPRFFGFKGCPRLA
jgi:hypothetical protein